MRRFLFNIYVFCCWAALATTGLLWFRSYTFLDEWHGWQNFGPAGLVHLYVQSNSGRVEIYASRAERVDAYNRATAWPSPQVPTYPASQFRALKPTRPEWGYADSFVPTPEPTHDFNWAYESRAEPADDLPAKYTWKAPTYLSSSATRREYRWLVAFPYGALAGLFGLPIVWRKFSRKKRKAEGTPGTAAAQPTAR